MPKQGFGRTLQNAHLQLHEQVRALLVTLHLPAEVILVVRVLILGSFPVGSSFLSLLLLVVHGEVVVVDEGVLALGRK